MYVKRVIRYVCSKTCCHLANWTSILGHNNKLANFNLAVMEEVNTCHNDYRAFMNTHREAGLIVYHEGDLVKQTRQSIM